MHLLTLALLLTISSCVRAQTPVLGTCEVWADPHLLGFPANPTLVSMRSGYWCQWSGQLLVLRNDFIEIYVNVTGHPYWNEYYIINMLSNGTRVCTISPSTHNCANTIAQVFQPRSNPNKRQIRTAATSDLDVSINSYTNGNGRLVYDISIVQSFSLIRQSTGLCVNRLPQCIIESKRRRKRQVSAIAFEGCDEFKKQAQQTIRNIYGNVPDTMSGFGYEACLTDVSETNDMSWGQSLVGLMVLNAMRDSSINRAGPETAIEQAFSVIDNAAAAARTNLKGKFPEGVMLL